jgi:hypothetical protein
MLAQHKEGREERTSFLQERSKKLLIVLAAASPNRARPIPQEFFGSFFRKRTAFFYPCSKTTPNNLGTLGSGGLHHFSRHHGRRGSSIAALWPAVLVALAGDARGAGLGQWDGFDIRWDTTLRETLAFRTEQADPALLAEVNGDDGDLAFNPGLVSARLDVFSEVTAERGDLGADLSAQAWYDPVYFSHNANRWPQSFNPGSVPYNRFPANVRRLMGGDAELLNAYARDAFAVDDVPVSVRLGRQTLLWGESLFFANNGIAAGQAPVDFIKALSAPLAQARELYLPVTQAVVRAELRPGLTLEAYDQFEWRRDRLPGVASYFSTTDILDEGGERVLVPNGQPLYRSADAVPHGLGQFGVALRMQGGAADYGIYALRYDAKAAQPVFDTAAGTYHLVFPSGIETAGVSVSTYAGASNLAGEISLRAHMPLVANTAGAANAAAGGGGAVYDAAYAASPPPLQHNPPNAASGGGFATGDTWHAQASIVSQFAPSRWWQAASLQAEVASNDLLALTAGHRYAEPGRTHFAASVQLVFTPTYFRVLPGLDLSFPLGMSYTPAGRSSIDATQNAGTGDMTASVSATYRAVWQAALSGTHFIGGAGVEKLADRDFVLLSVTRSF